MSRLIAIWLLCSLLPVFSGAQELRHRWSSSASYNEDTAEINRLVRISLPLVLNAATYDSALHNLKKIFLLSEKRHDAAGMAEYYRLLAVIYYGRQETDSVQPALDKEFSYAERSGDAREKAKALDLKAWLFQTRNEPDSATHYYIRTLAISDSLGDLKFSGEIYNNLSVLFLQIGDTASSGAYALKGYSIGRQLNDTLLLANCLFNLANAKTKLHELDTAYGLLEQIRLMVPDPARYNYVRVRAIANQSGILTDQGQTEQALEKLNGLLAIKSRIRPDLLSFLYSQRAFTLTAKGKYRQAEADLYQALAQLKAHPGENIRLAYQNSYRNMSEVQEDLGDYHEALVYKKKEDSVTSLIANETTRKNMHLLETRYQLARKDKLIAEQNLALARTEASVRQRNILVVFIAGGLLALLVILLLSIRAHRHKREFDRQSLISLQKQHEVETLRTSMEAREEERNRIGREMHDDIGSALTTILYLTGDITSTSREKSSNAARRISRIASTVVDKMNEIIWSMNSAYDTLDDMIAYSRQHAATLLEDHGLGYAFVVPDDMPDIRLSGEQRRNLYLSIKEALHNAIKHADATRVQIAITAADGIRITVHDNGKGICPEKLRRFGNGLDNMQQRMESIGGTFCVSGEAGTTVTLWCPVEETPAAGGNQPAATADKKMVETV